MSLPACPFLRPLSRILRPSSNRLHQPARLYSSRVPLTLDDVLPTTATTISPGDGMTPSEGKLRSTIDSGFENRPARVQERFGSRMGFGQVGRRSAIELGADPLRRRSGEKTHYTLLVHSTPNNTRLTLTHTPVAYLPGSSPGHPGFKAAYPMAGAVVARVTAGSVGFKRGRRQEYEAATQASLAMFNKIRDLLRLSSLGRLNSSPAVKDGPPRELEIVFNGFGIGRDAFMASLLNSQATDLRELVRTLRDSTTVKIGGPRPKKRRRV
ncbi:hypothetical protein PtA15_6A215 [Puccinia triticina]|uniref:Uncharacterized protein n=1 Tax=Puccinia triticina TaxID=208348 RepID=A0ABY7CS79_9BASI|nr:uncharacterized protein PtA15_6A215 [Puccinia triticina]WAQ85587.1 hypothetical protein PtA15_6A215 [Puccinia triticina]